MSRKGKRWILAKHFHGFPKETDMKLEEFDLPELKEGEVLLEAEYLSVDPYMRAYSRRLTEGSLMIGQQVAKVIESRNSEFPIGTWTTAQAGWTTHSVSDGKNIVVLPPLPEGVPRSYAIGTIGMPGLTAYFGLFDVCNLQPGETVLVSGAAGAVGNVVGQIAKIKGCRVIGSAGSEEKVKYIKDLGFDEAFNYKTTPNIYAKIKELAPKRVDVYFDNVGGDFAIAAIQNMNRCGRVACCGAISGYNELEPLKLSDVFPKIIASQLMLKGFLVHTYKDRYTEGLTALAEWVQQGKIKVPEHVTSGFENMFTAFTELFTGANLGKAVVKV